MAVQADPWQRALLARRLAALQTRYAGDAEHPVLPPSTMADLMGVSAGTETLAMPPVAFQFPTVFSSPPPNTGGGGGGGGVPLGPYNLGGDGSGWGPAGINLFNPLHARGDMPAPGPIGRGPGFWIMDGFGTPFWRQDWVPAPAGDPRGWLIRGEQ